MSKLVQRLLEGPDGRSTYYGILGGDVGINLHPSSPGFVPAVHQAEKFVRINYAHMTFGDRYVDVRDFRILGLKVGFINRAQPDRFVTQTVFGPTGSNLAATRTRDTADAFYLTREEALRLGVFGGSIANADSPVLGIRTYGLDGQLNGFGIAHCGLGCLVPSLTKPVDGVTQTTTAVEALLVSAMEHGPFSEVRAFMFGGIGPCCYGVDISQYNEGTFYDWWYDRYTRSGVEWNTLLEDQVIRGPREGQAAVDLYALTLCELMYLEKKYDVIIHADAWDRGCTACCDHDREASPYHSHVYAPKEIPDGNGGQQAPRGLTFYAVEL